MFIGHFGAGFGAKGGKQKGQSSIINKNKFCKMLGAFTPQEAMISFRVPSAFHLIDNTYR